MARTGKSTVSAGVVNSVGADGTYVAVANESPVSSRKVKAKVQMGTERPKRAVVIKIIGLQGNIAALFLEKGGGDDAYFHPLRLALEAGDLAEDGFFLLTNRRVSVASNSIRQNASNGYARKVFLVNLDENTPKVRKEAMAKAIGVLNLPSNNRFGIPYIITDASDLTIDGRYGKVDEWVLDDVVVDIVFGLYDNVTGNWATENPLDAESFFTGPPFCNDAVTRLGYLNEN
jgi:hypothetical protein